MSPRDLDRLNDAIRLDEHGTRRRLAAYTQQRHRGGRQLPPTARQLRRIVAKARRAGGGR